MRGCRECISIRRLAIWLPILRAFAKKGTKAVPYPDQPFALNTMQKGEKEQAKQEKQDEKAKNYFQALAMSFNKKFQEKGGGVNG